MKPVLKIIALLIVATFADVHSSTAQPLRVLAAENFYADIARQIGGTDVEVKSVLNNPGQDPHLFEASPSLARDVAAADVVILNGADYDPWMEKLIASAPSEKRRVIVVAELVGKKSGDNPHLWYDLTVAQAVAKSLAENLTALRPEQAAPVAAQSAAFAQSLQPLSIGIATIAKTKAGVAVAATEPVFGYMLDAMGLAVQEKNFQVAVMNGVEPSVSDIAKFEGDLKSRSVKVLVHNTQASSPLAEKMLALAQAEHIPVVGVTETLPPNKTYQTWLADEIAAVAHALEANP